MLFETRKTDLRRIYGNLAVLGFVRTVRTIYGQVGTLIRHYVILDNELMSV
jgi:hypothetical protein